MVREIEYNGKKYTQGEFEELMARELPGMALKTIENQKRVIQGSIRVLKGFDDLIKVTKDPGQVAKYEEEKVRQRKFIEESTAFLDLLLAMYPVTQVLSAAALLELDSLK